MKPNQFFAGAIFLVGLLNSTIFLPLVSNQQNSTLPPLPTITATPTATATLVIPTAEPTIAATPTSMLPTATSTPTATATTQSGPCSCERDLYNCSDFDTQSEAQACFDFCMAQVGSDVHGLDNDGNGIACEALPGQRIW